MHPQDKYPPPVFNRRMLDKLDREARRPRRRATVVCVTKDKDGQVVSYERRHIRL